MEYQNQFLFHELEEDAKTDDAKPKGDESKSNKMEE
jgi:hypothetical protein